MKCMFCECGNILNDNTCDFCGKPQDKKIVKDEIKRLTELLMSESTNGEDSHE